MPLPTLQTNPGIVTPQPANALMQAQKMQHGQMENALMGKKLGNYDEDRKDLKKTAEFQKRMQAIGASMKLSRNNKEFRKNMKAFGFEDVDVVYDGPDITMTITNPDGSTTEIKGPSAVVADAAGGFGEDPSHALDPEKGKKSAEYLARQGVSITQKAATAKYKEGELKDFKIGDKIVQQKYTGGEWVATGIEAPRYKPASVTVNLKQSSASEREKLASGEASLETLDNLKTLFDEAYVGPVAGRMGAVKDIFGGNEDKQSEFNAATFAFKNQIIKEITGAQMSEPEAKRIMKQVPDVNDPPSVWKAKWKQSKRNVAVLRKKRLEVMRKSGILTPEDPEVPETPKGSEGSYDFEYISGKGLMPVGGE